MRQWFELLMIRCADVLDELRTTLSARLELRRMPVARERGGNVAPVGIEPVPGYAGVRIAHEQLPAVGIGPGRPGCY